LARSDFFRRNAESCFAKAQQAGSEPARAAWLEMANQWHRLAQEAESDEVNRSPAPPLADDSPDAVVQQQQQIQPDSED
jgi:hypothetical protein